jgi:PAT family beta-lactamase induction signal transducer AmpG
LTTLGVGSVAIGSLLSAAWLPWTFKPLLGPLVDWLGHRKPFILAAELGMAVSLASLGLVNPAGHLGLFTALLFLHNTFAAMQDVGTDALALDLLTEGERGRANGYMSAAKYLGMLAGGQGLLYLAQQVGWFPAHLVAIGLLLVPVALLIRFVEPTRDRPPGVALTRQIVAVMKSRLVLLALVFAVVVDSADSLLRPMLLPFYNQTLGFSDQAIATLSSIGGAVAAAGAVLGGTMCDRFGRRLSLFIGCLASAGLTLVFASCGDYWGNYTFLLGFTVVGALVSGVIGTALLALFMDLTSQVFPATQFQLYMALMNMHGVWASRLGGSLAGRFSPTTMFRISAVVEVVPLVLLIWLGRPEKTKGSAATRP